MRAVFLPHCATPEPAPSTERMGGATRWAGLHSGLVFVQVFLTPGTQQYLQTIRSFHIFSFHVKDNVKCKDLNF